MAKSKNNAAPLIRNKRATFDYTIEERFEAGLQLRGWEVKSVRAGRSTINLSHVYVRDGELFLCNASFTPADQVCTHEKTEITRTRKLLMHRYEINKLKGKIQEKGYTLVPLQVYFKGSLVKVEIGLARGKKIYDKRADIAKKDQRRELEKEFKVKNLY